MASILVLDDSASIRQMVKTALADKGHTIIGATNGVQGMQLVGTNSFDLVITDLNMPEMDGIAFTREFRKRPDCRGVPVVFVTTESREAVKQEAKAAGATGWLLKPFSSDQLCRVVERLLGR